MAVLVIADHDNASVKDSTYKTVTAALALSGDVDVLVAGKDAKAAADAAAKVAGEDRADPDSKHPQEAAADV